MTDRATAVAGWPPYRARTRRLFPSDRPTGGHRRDANPIATSSVALVAPRRPGGHGAGDALVAGPSAVEAVQAAIEIQRCRRRERHPSDDRPMQLPHWGQFGRCDQELDGTIYGDGVDSPHASRHWPRVAGVCISSTVYDAVEGKLLPGFHFGRAPGQEHYKAGPRLSRARRVQATSGASWRSAHAMADRRAGLGAGPAAGLAGAWLYRDLRMPAPEGVGRTRRRRARRPAIACSPSSTWWGPATKVFQRTD